MKILWHAPAPWSPTGYGQQTALWVPLLASLGHEVALCAYSGLRGGPVLWKGHTVYPGGAHSHGADVLRAHAKDFGANLVITLTEPWKIGPEALDGLPAACWVPVDCEPLSQLDRHLFTAARVAPVAMSQFGREQLTAAGFEPLYIPHAVDTSVFRPLRDRRALRRAEGLDGKFVIGMNAANTDEVRKAWVEQMTAFSLLHAKHPDTMLLAHTVIRQPGGLDLLNLAQDLGIAKAVRFCDQYQLTSGQTSALRLSAWYALLDLYSQCSYAEGFGLTAAEAQACGVPAVATDFGAMREVCGGYLVPGSPRYVGGHRAWWREPSVPAILAVYEAAYGRTQRFQLLQGEARAHVLTRFDAAMVLEEHWKPALKALVPRC